jgi:hypothetical protein
MLTFSDAGQNSAGAQSFYDGQRSDAKVGLESSPARKLGTSLVQIGLKQDTRIIIFLGHLKV